MAGALQQLLSISGSPGPHSELFWGHKAQTHFQISGLLGLPLKLVKGNEANQDKLKDGARGQKKGLNVLESQVRILGLEQVGETAT